MRRNNALEEDAGLCDRRSRGVAASENRILIEENRALRNQLDRRLKLTDPEHKPRRIPSAKWRELIKKVWEADPLLCPKCSRKMRIVALSDDRNVIERILRHLGLWQQGVRVAPARAPPDLSERVIEPSYDDPFPDYGINHDGLGNLTGYAYGANIGWVTFESTGDPTVNLETGELSGYAWGANVGWISLSTLATLTLDSGPDTDADGIPDAWEYGHTNVLNVLADGGTDSDGDGVPDVDEYGADTDPFADGDFLRITAFQAASDTNLVTWPANNTRQYTLQHALALTNAIPWSATTTPFIPSTSGDVTETVPGVTDPARFYRVQAAPPLSP